MSTVSLYTNELGAFGTTLKSYDDINDEEMRRRVKCYKSARYKLARDACLNPSVRMTVDDLARYGYGASWAITGMIAHGVWCQPRATDHVWIICNEIESLAAGLTGFKRSEVGLEHIETGIIVKVSKSMVPGDLSMACFQNGSLHVVSPEFLLAHYLIRVRGEDVVESMYARAYAMMLDEQYDLVMTEIEHDTDLLHEIRYNLR